MALWQTVENPASVAALEIQKCFDRGIPVLLLVSGGSALAIYNETVLSPHKEVTVGLLDERYSRQQLESNSLQFEETKLFQSLKKVHGTFMSAVPHWNESAHDWGVRYCELIHEWCTTHPQGMVIAVFGMGEDMHTAGIFPQVFTAQKGAWYASYESTAKIVPVRLTATPQFIATHVQHAIGYICGNQKASVYAAAQKESDIKVAPIIIFDVVPRTVVYSDVPLP